MKTKTFFYWQNKELRSKQNFDNYNFCDNDFKEWQIRMYYHKGIQEVEIWVEHEYEKEARLLQKIKYTKEFIIQEITKKKAALLNGHKMKA